jgi:hypothetical protein
MSLANLDSLDLTSPLRDPPKTQGLRRLINQ